MKISEFGYPHVVVTPVVTFNDDSTKADVQFKIDIGPKVILGEVRYAGALKRRVLNRELKADKGMPFLFQRWLNHREIYGTWDFSALFV